MPSVRMLKPYSHRISPLSVRDWPGTGTFSMPDDIAAAAVAAGAAELVVEPSAAPSPFTPAETSVLKMAAEAIIAQTSAPAEGAAATSPAPPVAADDPPKAEAPAAPERRRRVARAK